MGGQVENSQEYEFLTRALEDLERDRDKASMRGEDLSSYDTLIVWYKELKNGKK